MKGKRNPISKATRFEVFKRDGFRCAYCGRTPPAVTLEVDHIDPRHNGGSDDINNLITACFDCNRGKSHVPLEKVPAAVSENLDVLKEKESQAREYAKYLKKIEGRIQKDIAAVDARYSFHFNKWRLAEKFRETSLRRFLEHVPVSEVIRSLDIAVSRLSRHGRVPDPDAVIKYFCGICWNMIKAGVTRPEDTPKA